MTQPVGILGGAFDPVHNGHLHLATTFLEQLKLAEVLFVPLNNPPHRPAPLASPEQRLEMLKLAVENHPHLKIDDCELQRGGVSYTIDTLRRIRKITDETPLCLIMGMENFKTLNSWRQWQSLLDYAHIVIANRPVDGDELKDDEIKIFMDNFITKSVTNLHDQAAGHIISLDIPMLDISSTQIRNIFQSGQETESLLPDKVLDFIHTHHLYKQ
ncbi:MAG: nicotinate-nucleotide adenylyltransferase [Proteobacteria bacterium]|nr:nicotinate-nucleotide adenylyltransferase [Pseudomonadota bacterium]